MLEHMLLEQKLSLLSNDAQVCTWGVWLYVCVFMDGWMEESVNECIAHDGLLECRETHGDVR
jgi:hypothetical protein